MYAEVKDGVVVRWPVPQREILQQFGHISVPRNHFETFAAQHGFVKPKINPAPPYDTLIEQLVLTDPYVDNTGTVVQDYVVEPKQFTAASGLIVLHSLIERAGETVVRKYPQVVREGWPEKLQEARAVVADPTTPTVLLAAEANVLGIGISDLAQVVIANAAAYAQLNGLLSGLLSKGRAGIAAAKSSSEIASVLSQINAEIQNALATVSSA